MTVAQVDAVAQAFHDGVANRDAGALAALYHDDARFLPPHMEACQGPEEIRAAMQGLLDAGASALDIEPVETREAGECTIEYGRFTLQLETPDGAITDTGKYIVVHETRDGETKIAMDIFNSDLPMPG